MAPLPSALGSVPWNFQGIRDAFDCQTSARHLTSKTSGLPQSPSPQASVPCLSPTTPPETEPDNLTDHHPPSHFAPPGAEYTQIPFRWHRWSRGRPNTHARPYPQMKDAARDRGWILPALWRYRRSARTQGMNALRAAAAY